MIALGSSNAQAEPAGAAEASGSAVGSPLHRPRPGAKLRWGGAGFTRDMQHNTILRTYLGLAYKLRRKFAETVGSRVVRFLSRRWWPVATALALGALAIPLQRGVSGGGHSIGVLALPKSGFIEDLAASVGGDARFRVVALDRTLIKAMAAAFLPSHLSDNAYKTDAPGDAAARAAYCAFWRQVWPRLQRLLGTDAVMTANFSYYAEQELAAAVSEAGQAFLTLHKECLRPPLLAEFYRDTYMARKLPFRGTAVLVYNAFERGAQVSAGMVDQDRVLITGMPRLDFVHGWRVSGHRARDLDARPPQVLFMSFNDKTGLPVLKRRIDGVFRDDLPADLDSLCWTKLAPRCHATMVELARRHPDINVVIKTKDHALAFATLEQEFGAGFVPPANLAIRVGGDPFELFTESDVMCAFNSTSLFEALAARLPVVVPAFDEAADPRHAPYLVDLGAAAEIARSPDELIDKLSAIARARHAGGSAACEIGPAAAAALETWVGNADGRAGERVRRAIEQAVGGARWRTAA